MKNKCTGFISVVVLILCLVIITHGSDGLLSSSSQRQQISTGSTREQLHRNRICLVFPSVWTNHQCHSWNVAISQSVENDQGLLLKTRPNKFYAMLVLALSIFIKWEIKTNTDVHSRGPWGTTGTYLTMWSFAFNVDKLESRLIKGWAGHSSVLIEKKKQKNI